MLKVPSIQHQMAVIVTSELKQIVETELSIGRINIGMLNRIIVDDIYLNDRSGEEMLKVTRLSAKFEILPLLKGKIAISSVQLFGFNIRLTKENPHSEPNFQFIVNAFASKDSIQKQTKIDLRINSVLIRRGKVAYDVLSEPETPGKFNARHVQLQNIIANISLKALRNDSLNAYIKRMSFEDKSGFELEKLSLRALGNTERLRIDNFQIDLPETSLKTNTIFMEYDSLEAFRDFANAVRFSGKIHSKRITLKDISCFVPALKDFTLPLQLNLKFDGTVNSLNCSSLEIRVANDMELLANAGFQDLSKVDDTYLFGNISKLHITQSGINLLYKNITGKSDTPDVLERLGDFSFEGEVSGYFNDLVTYGMFNSEVGSLRADVKLGSDKSKGLFQYSGRLISEGFQLGKLLAKEDKLGKISFNLEVDGTGGRQQWPEIDMKGMVSEIEFSRYNYENITLDGKYSRGGFDGEIILDDPNGSVFLNGSFNLAQEIPTFNFRAGIHKLRPYDLHLTPKYENAEFSLQVEANFTGNSVDNIDGKIKVDSLLFTAPRKRYELNNLNIFATQENGKKCLKLTSGFMNAFIRGDYSYRTIPASIRNTFHHYLPSLFRDGKDSEESFSNDFTFDVTIYDTEILPAIFDIPLEIHTPSALKGYFNDRAGKLRIEGYFPSFRYGDKRFESGMILCENPSDVFHAQARSTCFMKKGKTLNFAVNATAKGDKIDTSVYWGNSAGITYSGSFAATTNFFRTTGDKPFLGANIDVHPTKVVLNDTVWDIRSSRISLDSGRVFIDNFRFEHEKQLLCINGKLTTQAEDTVKVELNDINLGYVFDLVQFHAVDFRGMATGKVYASQVLKEPVLDTRLFVKNFSLNNGPLGNMNIYGTWDKKEQGIFLDAHMQEPGISDTKVKGHIFIKRKGLDLKIDADSTNIKFLEHFMNGIASDVKGRVTGNVRLFGGFKTLNLEGDAIADASFKFDVLGTSFELKRDSVKLIPDEIQFNRLTIYDPEGHQGTLDGYLRHTNLKNLSYRFQIDTENMLLFNRKEDPDLPFYGTVYGTGNVLLSGAPGGLNVDVAMRTDKNSNFVYITGLNNSATDNQFITFVDRTPKREMPASLLFLNSYAQEEKKEEDSPMDIRLNIQVDATADATMKIIIDPIAGDYIGGKGNGNIRLDYFNKGDVKMFGSYTIEQGAYKFSLQEIIRKDFIIQPGSTLTFNGNPMDANLDISASYTVNSASLSDLGLGESFTQNNVKVNCLMNLTGNLLKPTIKFDLELPNVNEEERELVKSAISTDEQMNMQILYLLGIGKFYTYDYGNNTERQSSKAMSSVLSSTLSGQLNNMFSQIIDNNNWNFGTTLSTGDKGWTDVEVEGMLSGQLLNNRLLVNGNFGYRDNPMANTNFVGDFDIEYLLTKSGEIRLKAYNQTNDRYYAKTTLTTQGVGVIYKKDFNKWRDLIFWSMKRKKKRAVSPPRDAQNKETEKTEISPSTQKQER